MRLIWIIICLLFMATSTFTSQRIISVKCIPDGTDRIIACDEAGHLSLRHQETPTQAIPTSNNAAITAFAISSNGEILALVYQDGTVETRSIRQMDQILWSKKRYNNATICVVTFMHQDKMIATGSLDSMLDILQTNNGESYILADMNYSVKYVAGLKLGLEFVLVSDVEYHVEIWDTMSGMRYLNLPSTSLIQACAAYADVDFAVAYQDRVEVYTLIFEANCLVAQLVANFSSKIRNIQHLEYHPRGADRLLMSGENWIEIWNSTKTCRKISRISSPNMAVQSTFLSHHNTIAFVSATKMELWPIPPYDLWLEMIQKQDWSALKTELVSWFNHHLKCTGAHILNDLEHARHFTNRDQLLIRKIIQEVYQEAVTIPWCQAMAELKRLEDKLQQMVDTVPVLQRGMRAAEKVLELKRNGLKIPYLEISPLAKPEELGDLVDHNLWSIFLDQTVIDMETMKYYDQLIKRRVPELKLECRTQALAINKKFYRIYHPSYGMFTEKGFRPWIHETITAYQSILRADYHNLSVYAVRLIFLSVPNAQLCDRVYQAKLTGAAIHDFLAENQTLITLTDRCHLRAIFGRMAAAGEMLECDAQYLDAWSAETIRDVLSQNAELVSEDIPARLWHQGIYGACLAGLEVDAELLGIDFALLQAVTDAIVADRREMLAPFRNAHAELAPKATPPFAICPLSRQIMTQAVMAADGYYYQLDAIQKWMQHYDFSPMTHMPWPHRQLTPANACLQSLIDVTKIRMLAHIPIPQASTVAPELPAPSASPQSIHGMTPNHYPEIMQQMFGFATSDAGENTPSFVRMLNA